MIYEHFYSHSTFSSVSKSRQTAEIQCMTMPYEQTAGCGCLAHHCTYDTGMQEKIIYSEQELQSCKSLCKCPDIDDQQSINGQSRLLASKTFSSKLDALASSFQRKKLRGGMSINQLIKILPSFDNISLLSESGSNSLGRHVSLLETVDAAFKHFETQDPGVNSERQGSHTGEDGSLIPGLGDDVAQLCLARLPRSTYYHYQTVSKKFCALFRSSELYRTRRRLGILEQWMYVLNSGRAWRAYNPKDGIWLRLPPTPSDYVFEVSDKESLTAGTQLLVRGRQFEGNVIWIYDLVTDQWFKGSDMGTPRCLYGSASCGDFGFVAGGVDYSGNLLKSAERYNSLIGRWEPLPDMNQKRKLCSGFYMDEKFYVIGGANEEGQLTCGEEYDLVSRTWRHIPNMLPISNHQSQLAPPLVAVAENRLYAFEASRNVLRVYDKATNSWRMLGDMPVRADVNNGWGVAFKALEGQLVVIGGHRGRHDSDDDAVWAWRPTAEGGPPDWHLMTRLWPVSLC
ncbi:hypothetical protein O6H91_11G069700 [Diphasiastrum complanatum]|uniref:Uncharacterized protein n=1 Tax=Diphasiastrum complanatum TaxID=34168 RepID=A0ACC2CAN1_DIPCM|nr:hypothetical protein O6H91_11G069700 [Diphasiastrum complanatum]